MSIPEPGADPEALRAAVARLEAVLQDGGVRPLPAVSVTARAVSMTFFMKPGEAVSLAGLEVLPEQSSAHTLQTMLRGQGITATVTTRDTTSALPGLVITLAGAADADLFADLVLQRLPAQHTAAQRLRHTLAAAGVIATGLRPDRDGTIRIGDVPARETHALGELLRGRPWGPLPDPDDAHDLGLLAHLVTEVVLCTTGVLIAISTHPGCDHCNAENDLALGTVTPDGAHRLADVIEDALALSPPHGEAIPA